MTGLYDLLPGVYQRRDATSGYALRGLLAVIEEQRDILSAGIDQLYDDCFIETCQDWLVPYLGELVGYRLLHGYEEALGAGTPEAGQLLQAIASRRDVADTIGNRRRKGTLALLQDLAVDVAGWPARAVEFRRLLAFAQPVRLMGTDTCARLRTGRAVDVRRGDQLARLDGPFEDIAHAVDVRRITSQLGVGRYGIDEVGLFVWRLGSYSITHGPAYCSDRDRMRFTFSLLGHDTPLGVRPVAEPTPSHLADDTDVPGFLRRRAFERDPGQYYGPAKSLCIWLSGDATAEPIPLSQIVPADLSGWGYTPAKGQVAVDPELGRIAFPPRTSPDQGVWVSYRHLFSADIGGGEYPRAAAPAGATVYPVGAGQQYETITAALTQWQADKAGPHPPRQAVVELNGSAAYQEQLDITVDLGDRLTVRAAPGSRPVIRLLDWYANRPDALRITGSGSGSGPPPQVTLDGLLVTGRSVRVQGVIGQLLLTDCTLVPGWSLDQDCTCQHPDEPSLELSDTTACVQIERCILGSIRVIRDEVHEEPSPLFLTDSVLDACARDGFALSGADDRYADVVLAMRRTTVLGRLRPHALGTVENSIITGAVRGGRAAAGLRAVLLGHARLEHSPALPLRAGTVRRSAAGRPAVHQRAVRHARLRPAEPPRPGGDRQRRRRRRRDGRVPRPVPAAAPGQLVAAAGRVHPGRLRRRDHHRDLTEDTVYLDLSRVRFDAAKHYSAVLLQQGRVILDSDVTEQNAIMQHYLRTVVADLIGPAASPAGARPASPSPRRHGPAIWPCRPGGCTWTASWPRRDRPARPT